MNTTIKRVMLATLTALLCLTLIVTASITFSSYAVSTNGGEAVATEDISIKCNHEWSHGNASPISPEGGSLAYRVQTDATVSENGFNVSYDTTYIPTYYYLDDDVTLDEDIIIGGNIEICLNGHTLTGTGNNSVVTVNSKATLTLYDCDENSSIGAITGGVGFVVFEKVEQNGSDSMYDKPTDFYYYYGGGVYVNKGTFTMYGGSITGNGLDFENTSSRDPYVQILPYGAGVYVADGTFTMHGGSISNNASYGGLGGGVYFNGGKFEMTGGVISDNEANNGGGVYVNGGAFEMSGGVITGNLVIGTYSAGGGGVCVHDGSFEMSGGEICDNRASALYGSGGGVDVEKNGAFTMEDGTTICRNNGGGVSVSGMFTMNGGTIAFNSRTNGNGGGVSVSGTFTMNGGTIANNIVTGNYHYGGGVGVYYTGNFVMKGGLVEHNEAPGGGGVYVENGAELDMRANAKITNNTAINNGGGVYVHSNGKFSISGTASIEQNTASSLGGGVYHNSSSCTLTIGGAARIYNNKVSDNTTSNLYLLNDKTVNTDKLVYGAQIGVTLASGTGVFTSGWSANNSGSPSKYFVSDDQALGVMLKNGEATIVGDGHIHNGLVFEAFNGATTLTEGAYYLTSDVDCDITVSSDNVELCLNGFTITGTGNGSVITIGVRENSEFATLVLHDCSNDHGGKITGGEATNGGGVYVGAWGKLTMNGGVIVGNKATNGGGVYVDDGIFILNDGTISKNTATNGGGVYGSLRMNGGLISGNEATQKGGGVYSIGSISGGTISENKASYGGGWYGSGSIEGGTITDNTATANGGGIFISSAYGNMLGGYFTLRDGVIKGNNAVNGGGVYVGNDWDNFTMLGGAITSNVASSCGGGIYLENTTADDFSNGSSMKILGGSITHNKAAKGGGIYFFGDEFDLCGVTVIRDNSNTDNAQNNVHIANGNAIIVVKDKLEGDADTRAYIGVTLENGVGLFASGWLEAYGNPLNYFASDDADKCIVHHDGELVLTEHSYTQKGSGDERYEECSNCGVKKAIASEPNNKPSDNKDDKNGNTDDTHTGNDHQPNNNYWIWIITAVMIVVFVVLIVLLIPFIKKKNKQSK